MHGTGRSAATIVAMVIIMAKITALLILNIFTLLWVILQQGQLIYLARATATSSAVAAPVRYEVEVLKAEALNWSQACSAYSPRLARLESSLASVNYRSDLLILASRTGWWSAETLALVGREYLYLQRQMEYDYPEWGSQ